MKISKIAQIMGLSLMIISSAKLVMARGLITDDMRRCAASAQVGLQQAKQVKQEVDSNMKIAKEIQNGGYAAAAGDVFAKVENGDYDRFGNNLKDVKNSALDSTRSAAEVERRKKEEAKKRQEKEKKMLEKQKAAKEKGDAAAQEAHEKANESFGKRAYKWIKSNRLATTSGLDAINNAKDGNWSGVLENAGRGTGSVVGGDDGSEISALGGITSATVDIAKGSNNLGEALTNTVTNGKLTGSINSIEATEEAKDARWKAAEQAVQQQQNQKIQDWFKENKPADYTPQFGPAPNVGPKGDGE